ncbi:MAG: penicillin-binding protein 2 [Acidimicrobiia bacterium]|nr:MAG: penicillin-binding protein 2 [Acidimicrobiia bacterium]
MRRVIWRVQDARVVVLGLVLILAWSGIGYRLFQVQGADAAELTQRGFDQRVRHEEILPKRGTIYDRDGIELAVTVYGSSLVADPALIDDPAAAAALIGPLIGANIADVAVKLESDGRYVLLARRLENSQEAVLAAAIEESELDGFSFVEELIRVYPSGSLAAPVLGLTRLDDGAGIEGIEAIMDGTLAGRPGKRIVERDAAGRAIPQGELLIDPATPGSDVILTLDREIQYTAEQVLGKTIDETGSVGGSVIVMVPSTGRILAMVSLPGFDPNDRSGLDPATLRNRAVADVYEPGSTLKVVTVSAALELGIVEPSTMIETPHEVEVGDEVFEDHANFPSEMTVADVVAKSSNVGTIEIQRRLGNEQHYAFLDAYGLGRQASIDFNTEAAGVLDHYTTWCRSTCGASAAIGYGIGATPIQMAGVYATIANGGEWVEPHVVAEIIGPDGERVVTEPRRREVISAETAGLMLTMLRGVVERGTGRRASIDGFSVGGKTGTSRKFDVEQGAYSEDLTIAWFVGIAPIDDPAIVIAVVLDSPIGVLDDGTQLKFGGASAAPVFAAIAESALNQLGVAPDED